MNSGSSACCSGVSRVRGAHGFLYVALRILSSALVAHCVAVAHFAAHELLEVERERRLLRVDLLARARGITGTSMRCGSSSGSDASGRAVSTFGGFAS